MKAALPSVMQHAECSRRGENKTHAASQAYAEAATAPVGASSSAQ